MKDRLKCLVPSDEARGRNRDTTTADLWEALSRLQRTEVAPTIAALAREVGVSAALIHNRYGDVAKEVRRLSGREPGSTEEGLKLALKQEREVAKGLRTENLDLRKQLQAMGSVNETLRQELRILQAMHEGKIVSLPRSR